MNFAEENDVPEEVRNELQDLHIEIEVVKFLEPLYEAEVRNPEIQAAHLQARPDLRDAQRSLAIDFWRRYSPFIHPDVSVARVKAIMKFRRRANPFIAANAHANPDPLFDNDDDEEDGDDDDEFSDANFFNDDDDEDGDDDDEFFDANIFNVDDEEDDDDDEFFDANVAVENEDEGPNTSAFQLVIRITVAFLLLIYANYALTTFLLNRFSKDGEQGFCNLTDAPSREWMMQDIIIYPYTWEWIVDSAMDGVGNPHPSDSGDLMVVKGDLMVVNGDPMVGNVDPMGVMGDQVEVDENARGEVGISVEMDGEYPPSKSSSENCTDSIGLQPVDQISVAVDPVGPQPVTWLTQWLLCLNFLLVFALLFVVHVSKTLHDQMALLQSQNLGDRLALLEFQNLSDRMALFESQNIGSRLALLESQNMGSRLALLESHNLGGRIAFLESQNFVDRVPHLARRITLVERKVTSFEGQTISLELGSIV